MITLIKNNTIDAKSLKFPLSNWFEEPKLRILSVKENKIFNTETNSKTNQTESFTYELMNQIDCSTFRLKVMGDSPLITSKELEESEEPYFLFLDTSKVEVIPYKIEYGKATISIKCDADAVKLISLDEFEENEPFEIN